MADIRPEEVSAILIEQLSWREDKSGFRRSGHRVNSR